MTDRTPLTDQQLDEIETRANAATPGPWELYEGYGPHFYAYLRGCHLQGIGTLNFGDGEAADADREFVTHAREDVPALLAEVHRLRALLAQCDHRACAGFPDDCPNPVLVNPDPPAHFGGVRCGCRPATAAAVVSSAAEGAQR
ncbi:hypothetical protein ACWDBO_31285 [Streptomyces mirabilis]|uniref:hypothetical protein n=1 Tax=Streptomyces mirabilis TaxID=68239 RepID=UPI003333568F